MEEDVIMTPVGVLRVEHLLIARMMDLMERKLGGMKPEAKPDMVFVDGFADFAKTYADACHHGKEESLFEKLAMKNLRPEHKKLMDELVLEHIQARNIVANLEIAREDFLKGDPGASQRILTICKSVWQIYPGHMAKEEKVFFPPALEYFSKREQDELMKRFWEFDKNLLLEKYIKFFDQFTCLGGTKGEVLVKGLAAHGWVEGRNLAVQVRVAETPEESREGARQLIGWGAEVLVGYLQRVRALAQETSRIPIVAGLVVDPVAMGFAKSLREPGGNVPGLSLGTSESPPLQVGLMRAFLPGLRRVHVLVFRDFPEGFRGSRYFVSEATARGLDVVSREFAGPGEAAEALGAIRGAGRDCAIAYPFGDGRCEELTSRAVKRRLALFSAGSEFRWPRRPQCQRRFWHRWGCGRSGRPPAPHGG